MTDELKSGKLSILCRKFLGLPGETLAEFSGQWKRLTEEDRDELKRDFEAAGFTVLSA